MDTALLFSAGIAVVAALAALIFLPGRGAVRARTESGTVEQVA
jgi:hypothetical protein